MKTEYLVKLHQRLCKRFDEGELRTLCFHLGIDYDALPGEGKESRARELITYLDRRDRVLALIEAGCQLRPDISWDDILKTTKGTDTPTIQEPIPEWSSESYRYEIALSFAGEDRPLVEMIATGLRRRRVKVFYDRFEQATLWGKDLYQYLFDVYSGKSRYCVVFISGHYVSRPWTHHELKAAQSRQFGVDSEYILPVRLDDSRLPGLPETVGYIDARDLSPDEIVEVIVEKLGRKQPRLFRGMDLGHDIDPLRSSLAKMDPALFEEICIEVLACFKYQAAHQEALASSILSCNAKIGKGWIRTGVFFDTFTYAQQIFTEIGYGVDKDVSRVLGQETYFSEGGITHQLRGPCVVVVHSCVEDVPDSQDILAFGKRLKDNSITNTIFLINESVHRTNYFGIVDHPLTQMGLSPVVLFVEDLAYQVLTTETYRKYQSRLKWTVKNPL